MAHPFRSTRTPGGGGSVSRSPSSAALLLRVAAVDGAVPTVTIYERSRQCSLGDRWCRVVHVCLLPCCLAPTLRTRVFAASRCTGLRGSSLNTKTGMNARSLWLMPLWKRQRVFEARSSGDVPTQFPCVVGPSLPFIPCSSSPCPVPRCRPDDCGENMERNAGSIRPDNVCPSHASYLFTLACVKPIAQ